MGGTLSREQLEDRHIVIVGGGYAGIELAVTLQGWKIPFTLIDPKEYFHHNIGALRAVVKNSYLPNTAINFKATFGENFRQAKVVSIDKDAKKVTLDDGSDIDYSDLVLAVGSTGPFPGKAMECDTYDKLKAETEALGEELDKATSVIIIGGGAVGVEFAGEIVDKYGSNNKQVTIIHSGSHLVSSNYGRKFQDNINSVVRSKGIQTLLGEKVSNIGDLSLGKYLKQTVETNKGQSYSADIVIKCTGLRPNVELTKETLEESKFDSNDRIKVSSTLLVVGEKNIYAIGDCCNTNEEKLAAHCSTHAQLVANNIYRDLKGQDKLPYKQAFTGMLLTIGVSQGAGVINGWNFPSFVVGLMKGRGLFTSKFWSMMGQKMPT